MINFLGHVDPQKQEKVLNLTLLSYIYTDKEEIAFILGLFILK